MSAPIIPSSFSPLMRAFKAASSLAGWNKAIGPLPKSIAPARKLLRYPTRYLTPFSWRIRRRANPLQLARRRVSGRGQRQEYYNRRRYRQRTAPGAHSQPRRSPFYSSDYSGSALQRSRAEEVRRSFASKAGPLGRTIVPIRIRIVRKVFILTNAIRISLAGREFPAVPAFRVPDWPSCNFANADYKGCDHPSPTRGHAFHLSPPSENPRFPPRPRREYRE